MRQPPRVGGDGCLRLPGKVSEEGFVFGREFVEEYDPFERLDSKLYLAEDFARAQLSGREGREWRSKHGMADPRSFRPTGLGEGASPTPVVVERPDDVRAEQQNVAWHLRSLVHLSDHLPGDGATPTGNPEGWDERWVLPAVGDGPWLVRLGGADREPEVAWDVARAQEAGWSIPPDTDDDPWAWAGALPEAVATYEAIVAEDVARLAVPVAPHPFPPSWPPATTEFDPLKILSATSHLTQGLGTGWWDLVKLQLRLMEPYIRLALGHRVEIVLAIGTVPITEPAGVGAKRDRDVIQVRERRVWRSVLAPIYLHLLEGLRRVTEGHRAAASCQACEQPFLTLDARRTTYCNSDERNRFMQRQHRLRAGAKPRRVRLT